MTIKNFKSNIAENSNISLNDNKTQSRSQWFNKQSRHNVHWALAVENVTN